MAISQIKAIQIAKLVDHILHVPGNFRGGNLEMTVVVDSRLSQESRKENVKQIIAALKRSNEIFRNVRLNLVHWEEEQKFDHEIVPMIFLQTGACFLSKEKETQKNLTLDHLLTYLKIFHARSKVVLIFTQADYQLGDKKIAAEALSPFLKQKLLLICGEEARTGTQLFMESIK